jgi:hypothetical protein
MLLFMLTALIILNPSDDRNLPMISRKADRILPDCAASYPRGGHICFPELSSRTISSAGVRGISRTSFYSAARSYSLIGM